MKNSAIILLLFISATSFSQETTFISPSFEIAKNTNGEWNLVSEDNNLETNITISGSKIIFKNENEKIVIYNLVNLNTKQDELRMEFKGNYNSATGEEVLILFSNNGFHILKGNKVYTYKNIQ